MSVYPQTCDQQRFEIEKVSFSWKCLNIFATGCSTSRKSFPVPFNQEGEVPFLSFSTPVPTFGTFCSSLGGRSCELWSRLGQPEVLFSYRYHLGQDELIFSSKKCISKKAKFHQTLLKYRLLSGVDVLDEAPLVLTYYSGFFNEMNTVNSLRLKIREITRHT